MSEIKTEGGIEIPEPERARITRRAAIRATIGAGAAVWVAPVIIDSLASPAAAVTANYSLQYSKSSNGNANCTTPLTTTDGGVGCNPGGFVVGQSVPSNATAVGATISCGATTTFTVAAPHQILAGIRCSGGTAGTIAPGGLSISWTLSTNGQTFRLVVS